MTDTTPGADPTPTPLGAQITTNIKVEVVRAGHKFAAIEKAVGLSHPAAARRLSGAARWKLAEIRLIARWLGIERSVLLPGLNEDGTLSWELAEALDL